MTRTTIAALALAAGALGAPTAFAQTYAGAGYTIIQADVVGGGDVTLGALTGRVGHEFNPFFAVEADASVGIDDDTYSLGGPQLDASLNHQFGVYAVGKFPLPAIGSVFGRAGYSTTSIDALADVADGGGVSYGVGVEFDFIPGIETRLEYTDFDTADFQSFGLSAQLKF